KRLGIPVVPGSDGAVTPDQDAMAIAKEIGFPVLVKAAAGGGGFTFSLDDGEDERDADFRR
ncbi:MAG: acetyl-CoA carboxylase biotin carboxylase subunit, partial [Streptococcus sp.]|nr:acetyl-CoA carboxylase biotin carboxylase subunit [Streptococcus sp.]